MTIQDLLDNIARAADDTSSDYETAARRWLNLTRSYISPRARWREASVIATFDTDSANTDSLYPIEGISHFISDWLYDETNDQTIQKESLALLDAADPSKEVDGPPTMWADAGVHASGKRMIKLWPLADGTYTIRYFGYKRLTDLLAADDTKDTDPFFGPITEWAACFSAGIKYYHDLDNNEDAQQIFAQKRVFDQMIRDRKSVNTIAPTSSMRLSDVRHLGAQPGMGRFDPAHYRNR